nr:uncharacterized protein LOC117988505 [Maniola hyperantus]
MRPESKRNEKSNFINGLQNARGLLNCLERSFEKSCKYEDNLLRCRATHNHSHDSKDWCSEESTTRVSGSYSRKEKSKSCQTRSSTNGTESWSSASIACLQYQYEELSKRYQMLLRAYGNRCNSLTSHDGALIKLYKRVKETHAELAHVNKSLLIIGEKYLNLKYKRLAQKIWYEERIERMKRASRAVVLTAERARRDLDEQLARSLACEQDTAIILLLEKIRKCNHLFLENLRLKSRIEEMI